MLLLNAQSFQEAYLFMVNAWATVSPSAEEEGGTIGSTKFLLVIGSFQKSETLKGK